MPGEREGQTWKQVVEYLKAMGCQTDPPAVLRFIKKYEVKPFGVGQKPASKGESFANRLAASAKKGSA